MRRSIPRSAAQAVFACIIISAAIAQTGRPIVAVADFSGTGASAAELTALRGGFEAELFKTGAYDVVERAQAESILKEQEYQLSGCVDDRCIIEIGKQLGAQFIFVGAVSRIGTTVQIIVKMVDIRLSKITRLSTISGRTVDELFAALPRAAMELAGRTDLLGGSGGIVWDSGGPGSSGVGSPGGPAAERAYVQFESTPSGMSLVIKDSNGKAIGSYETPKSLPLGKGSYTIEAEDPAGMYYQYKGNLDFSKPAKARFSIAMAPRFGTVNIQSDPPGARVSLNGIDIGTTPIAGRQLKSGSYEIALSMDLYSGKRITMLVSDGKAASVSEKLAPNFVTLDARENNGLPAEVWVDGKKLGDAPYWGKVAFRDFSLIIKPKDGRYKPYEEKIIVRSAGESLSRLIALEGRTGTLLVETEPSTEAEVWLDGRRLGTAPDMFAVLAGEHELRVSATLNGQKVEAIERVGVSEGQERVAVVKLRAVTAPARIVSGGRDGVLSDAGKGLINSVGMNLVHLAGGSFMMGDTAGGGGYEERPIRQVSIDTFRISATEVTQDQWIAVMGTNPSRFKGGSLPVENVSWYDAIVFSNKLSKIEGLSPCYSVNGSTDPNLWGVIPTSSNPTWNMTICDFSANGYRLPTEAEWEYAAKGGAQQQALTIMYAGSMNLDEVAWTSANSGDRTRPVATKKPNSIGLYDMTGNVSEWCWDWYEGSYSPLSLNNPKGSHSGPFRVFRGGSWYNSANDARVSKRYTETPSSRFYFWGFRVVRRP